MVNAQVTKYELDNGLTILVMPQHAVPRVTVQIMYGVGSKDEDSSEKGKAHLIEHMIFKGTETMSESDINMISYKLSGKINAFTGHDYTGYYFDFPTANWKFAMPILADCMKNCTFKQELLNSEMKAVIQELKMYKDNNGASLVESMLTAIFPDHPYHYPIIGYKQDLWDMDSQDLKRFYHKHYVPNNATLVVVGDVDPEQVYQEAKKNFASIPEDKNYQKKEFYHNKDLSSVSVTLQRDVQQPIMISAFCVPGARSKQDFVMELASWIIGCGRGSILYRRLVEQEGLAVDVHAFSYDLFDSGAFMIQVVMSDQKSMDKINEIICQEMQAIAKNGVTDAQIQRAVKNTESGYLTMFEDNTNLVYELAKSYLATGDQNYLLNYIEKDAPDLAERVQKFVVKYLRPSVMYRGSVVPFDGSEKELWLEMQRESDELDVAILAGKERDSGIEPGVVVNDIEPNVPVDFDYPKAEMFTLKNGIKVLFHRDSRLPKVNLVLDLKAKSFYDSDDKPGLINFMNEMLLEGTLKYNSQELADLLESNGISLNCSPGRLSLGSLTNDFELGCKLAAHVLSEPAFDKEAIERVRARLFTWVKYQEDSPRYVGMREVKNLIYKDHPYRKETTGSSESIANITRDDLVGAHKSMVSNDGARIAVIGDIDRETAERYLNDTLGNLQGQKILDIDFPALQPVKSQEINKEMNRDQVILIFAGLSTDRLDPDYDKMLIFNQIFGGGALGSMSNRLFALRERSGLFYTIRGSLTAGSDEQPGMAYVITMVTKDNLGEAEQKIAHEINTAMDVISEQEFIEAKNAIISALVGNFTCNARVAEAFLFVDQYGFDRSFFDNRIKDLQSVTIEEVRLAAKRVLSTDQMALVRVGRV